jgi:hypothetical protein
MVAYRFLSVLQGGRARRPPLWPPPLALSTAAHALSKRIRRAKFLVWLRQHRHELCAATLQQDLLILSKDQPQGQPPIPLPPWPWRRRCKPPRRSPMLQ